MASNEENWIGDIINDFIHSSIWSSPIQTFIDTNCACFDYDDENEPSSSAINEQKHIFKKYQNLVDSLMTSLSEDLKLNKNELKGFYQTKNSTEIDESYEQLHSRNDLYLFTEMMKRKNLILQLQALVNLQVEYGLLKPTDTNEDRVLQLLLQATSSSRKASGEDSSNALPDLKRKGGSEINTDRHRQTQSNEIEPKNEPQTIDAVPEDILREKLRELTIGTQSSDDDETASAMSARKSFLKQQRDLIVNKQRDERIRELEKETINARPQSAANVARKAMGTTNKQEITNDELEKRRAMAAKLRRELNNEPETILRESTINTGLPNDAETASAMLTRKSFLKQQCDLIVNKQRGKRVRELEKETINAQPQSAA